jgi:deoxyribose-phosphate aldolase
MIDHTQLRAYATEIDIRELCSEAVENGFPMVNVNPAWTSYCAKQLAGTNVGICTCVGFPLGANTAAIKVEEARDAVRNGANELDLVINIGALKSGYPTYVLQEISAVVKAVKGIPVKVILECSFLTDEEKASACAMAVKAEAAFVSTATGYGHGGATVEDVALLRDAAGDAIGIKAAGGIRTYGDAIGMIQAGATRLGSSTGVSILEDMPKEIVSSAFLKRG